MSRVWVQLHPVKSTPLKLAPEIFTALKIELDRSTSQKDAPSSETYVKMHPCKQVFLKVALLKFEFWSLKFLKSKPSKATPFLTKICAAFDPSWIN